MAKAKAKLESPEVRQAGKTIILSLPYAEPLRLTIQTKEKRDKTLVDARKLIERYNKTESDRTRKTKINALTKMFTLEAGMKQKVATRKDVSDELSKQLQRKQKKTKESKGKRKVVTKKNVQEAVATSKKEEKTKSTPAPSSRQSTGEYGRRRG